MHPPPLETRIVMEYRNTQAGVVARQINEEMAFVVMDDGNNIVAYCPLHISREAAKKPVVEVAMKGEKYPMPRVMGFGCNITGEQLYGFLSGRSLFPKFG